ncbi:MAG TPA: phosphoribosylamine--glycine ligase [Candidatus Sulfomarinibacteraceae bacterium]|nr:phosphoribosylamine--glycine ligase [Candidatus Sulfomarinibacteraceae bacterium]
MSLTTPTRILVVGSGGREHALAWKLAAEPGVRDVFVAPGSAGIAAEPGVRILPGVDPLDPASVVAAAREVAAELVVVGPEAPLAAGVADALEAAGIPVFGPSRAAARLETSKAFCHEVAAAAGVRMARARAFESGEGAAAADFIRELHAGGAGAVLKADGLAGGKGVIVADSLDGALDLVPGFLAARPAGAPVLVVEERLHGREASVIAISDGRQAVALPPARDHKRLCDGDHGPNTGGMGAYSPLPDLDDAAAERILETVHGPILAEMRRRGTPFRGFLYAGLMLTTDGPALLECNARLGDPEAQAILPRVATALGPILLAAAHGHLPAALPPTLPAMPDATVTVVLAAKGYPGSVERGHAIDGLDDARAMGALVFHGGTAGRPAGGFGTNGGRVLAVVGRGATLAHARDSAERAADAISWDGLHRRRDIAADLPDRAAPAVPDRAPVAASGVAS